MALSDVVYWLRVWGLSFALGISALKVVTILPPATDISITKRFLPESFSNYWPGVTLHEIVDFLVIFPFAVVSLKLVYAFGTPAYSTMRDFLLCTVVRTLIYPQLWVEGHGLHLLANAIDSNIFKRALPNPPAVLYDLVYFCDENMGHAIWFLVTSYSLRRVSLCMYFSSSSWKNGFQALRTQVDSLLIRSPAKISFFLCGTGLSRICAMDDAC